MVRIDFEHEWEFSDLCKLKVELRVNGETVTMDLQAANLSQSLGPSNQLFMALIQTLLTIQSSISPPSMWPGSTPSTEYGKYQQIF